MAVVYSNKRDYKRKRRIKSHVIADLSANHVEKMVFDKGYVVDCSRHDYGYDLSIETFNSYGEYENGQIRVQLKAKVRPAYTKSKSHITFSCDKKDINLWYYEPHPVILVIYDGKKKKAYWLYMQQYLRGIKKFDLKKLKKTYTVKVPVANLMDENAIMKFRKFKQNNMRQALNVITYS